MSPPNVGTVCVTAASMRIHVASDHAGFELKRDLSRFLVELGHDVVDCGAHLLDPEDDYPPFCIDAAERTVALPGSLGIVIGGSGNGEQIAANKVTGARCALAWSPQTARLAREHNDAQLIALGARMHSTEEASAIVQAFLEHVPDLEPRHRRRIGQLDRYELTGSLQ